MLTWLTVGSLSVLLILIGLRLGLILLLLAHVGVVVGIHVLDALGLGPLGLVVVVVRIGGHVGRRRCRHHPDHLGAVGRLVRVGQLEGRVEGRRGEQWLARCRGHLHLRRHVRGTVLHHRHWETTATNVGQTVLASR